MIGMFLRQNPVSDKVFPLDKWNGGGYTCREVAFRSGSNTLRGYCALPTSPRALVLIAHGLLGKSDGYEPVVEFLLERGYAVFIFDGTASGRSDGSRIVGLQQSRLDTRAAVDHIAAEDGLSNLPLVIFGHSAGAYAAATEAERSSAAAVVCVSAFDRPIDTMHYMARGYVSVLADIELPFLLMHEYAALGSNANSSASEALIADDIPALIAHGELDARVPLAISLYDSLVGTNDKNITLFLDETESHSGHGNILFTEDGTLNAALLEAIDAFLSPIVPVR